MIRKRFRLTLASLGAAAATLVAAATIGASHSVAAPAAAAASGPTAAQLLAKTSSCTPASNGAYATDDGGPATVSICRSGSAYFWTSDMDIDCDGITTSHCNASTDPWYQAQTSFTTSTGSWFTSDVTHYFVIPLPSSRFDYASAGIAPGSVAAVVYNGRVAYAVFADEGPDDIIGEGSYALATALGIDPDPDTGGTDGPVTFIVFPGQVPNPVENNTTIDTVGSSAANAWVGGSGSTGGSTTGGTTPPPSGTGRIVGYGSKCVDVAGASSANGTAVQLYDCNGTTAQNWTVGSDGTIRALGKCLDVTSAGTANGTKLQLWDCNGSGAQKWAAESDGHLKNPSSGRYVDLTGGSTANGTRLQIWDRNSNPWQLWHLPA